MKLVNVYLYPQTQRLDALYELLQERGEAESISHEGMPTYEQHVRFVESRPYAAWYFIVPDWDHEEIKGCAYITRARSGHRRIKEVGIHLFKAWQGKGIGREALNELKAIHGTPLYANISPANDGSARFFEREGFHMIQHTYRWDDEDHRGTVGQP